MEPANPKSAKLEFVDMEEISSDIVIVSSGVTSTGLLILKDGILKILNEGIAFSIEADNDGSIIVSRGGVLFICSLSNGGNASVLSGGYAQDIIVSEGGRLLISSGGTAYKSIVLSGGTQIAYSKTRVTSADIMTGGVLHINSGGYAEAPTVSQGGSMFLSGAAAVGAVIRGSVEVDAKAELNDAALLDGGLVRILSNSYADAPSVSSGAMLDVASGCSVNAVNVYKGGEVVIAAGASSFNTQINGGKVTLAGAIVPIDPAESTTPGGYLSNVTVNQRGTLIVSSGATTTKLKENGGYVVVLDGAAVTFASNTISGLELSDAPGTVHSGTTATNVTVNAGGNLEVFSGGTATNVVENGGWVEVADGAKVSFAQNTISGLALDNTSGTVHSGTTATEITINSGAFFHVSSGGIANSTIANSGGGLIVSSGGTADVVTVDYGGGLAVFSGGTALRIKENGGLVHLDDNESVTFVSNTFSGVILDSDNWGTVHSGTTATDITINSDGNLSVFNGGTANVVTINPGGTIEVPGGMVNGATVSSGGNLLVSSGGKLTGKQTYEAGAVVSLYEGVILDFNISELTPETGARVSNLAIIQGTPVYTLTVSDEQAKGMYTLAEGAPDFNCTLTVRDTLGESIGMLTVTDRLVTANTVYTLNAGSETATDALLLTVAQNERPTVSNIQASETKPTSQDVVITAEFADDVGLAQSLYKIGEAGEWTDYVDGVVVTENTTVFFKAVDITGNESEIASYEVTNIDRTGPVITLSGNTTTTLKQTTLTAESDDGSEIYFRISEFGVWKKYTGPIIASFNETYYFKATDAAGNEGTNFLTFGNIDTTAPVITLSGDNQTPLQKVTLTASTDDGSPIYYRIGDSGEWTEYKEPITVTDNATYNFLSTDVAGNEGMNFLTFGNIDNVAPEITLSGDNQTPVQQATLTASTDDGSSIYYRIGDTGDWTEYKEPITVTDNATYNFLSTDAAGNEGTNFLSFDNIDTVAPVITLSGDNQTPLQQATLTASTDDGSSIYYRIGNTGDWTEYKEPITVTDNATYNFLSTDAAGNEGTNFLAFNNIDTTKPVITLTGDNQTPLQISTLTASIDDGSDIFYSTDQQNWSKYEAPIDVNANATYYFKATDAAGNEGTAEYVFANIDTTAPVIVLSGDNQTPLQSSTLTASVDDGSPIFYRIGDTGDWTEYKDPIAVTDNATYNFLSTDAAGNEGTNFLVFNNIDTTKPVITLSGDNQTPLQSSTLTASTDDGSPIYYRIGDTGDWTEYKEPITVTDNATYNFLSTDAAGNEGTESIVFANIIQAPVSEVAPQTQTWEKAAEGTKYIVELSTDDGYAIQLMVDSNSLDSFQMPAGSYQMRVKPEGGDWTVLEPIVAPEVSTEPKIVKSNEDGNDDLFFATTNGTWENIYYAQHVGSINDWTGTNEIISASGKGRIQNLFFGSSDPNVLCLTDGENGDAIFVDDVYTELPEGVEEHTARLYKIQEVRAGFGDDIVDMTSQRFEYTGDGLTIRGGDGNDTIWANKGDNFLFGDAGNDRIVGASGNDMIAGGIGNDRMHGGGGDDIFTFCDNWGTDTVEQLAGGSVTLWFTSEMEGKVAWDDLSESYTDGVNHVSVKGISSVELKFGGVGEDAAMFATLSEAGAFKEFTSQKIFEENKGLLA